MATAVTWDMSVVISAKFPAEIREISRLTGQISGLDQLESSILIYIQLLLICADQVGNPLDRLRSTRNGHCGYMGHVRGHFCEVSGRNSGDFAPNLSDFGLRPTVIFNS